MSTSLRVSKQTLDLLNQLKGSKTQDQYLFLALYYFVQTGYNPENITANPVFDMGALFNRRFDQLKGMLVNFQKENNLRCDKIDNAIIERGVVKVNQNQTKENSDSSHSFTSEELQTMLSSIELQNEQIEKYKKEISTLKSDLRKTSLNVPSAPSASSDNIDLVRLSNLIKEIDKYMKVDKFDTSGTTMTINKDVYNLRMVEVLKILNI